MEYDSVAPTLLPVHSANGTIQAGGVPHKKCRLNTPFMY